MWEISHKQATERVERWADRRSDTAQFNAAATAVGGHTEATTADEAQTTGAAGNYRKWINSQYFYQIVYLMLINVYKLLSAIV